VSQPVSHIYFHDYCCYSPRAIPKFPDPPLISASRNRARNVTAEESDDLARPLRRFLHSFRDAVEKRGRFRGSVALTSRVRAMRRKGGREGESFSRVFVTQGGCRRKMENAWKTLSCPLSPSLAASRVARLQIVNRRALDTAARPQSDAGLKWRDTLLLSRYYVTGET